jgi:hypothetical protein
MMPFFLDKKSGEMSPEAKEELLLDMWDYGMHIIPCGSPAEVVPKYFSDRNPFTPEDELRRKWSKTPKRCALAVVSEDAAIEGGDHPLA